MVWFHYLIAIVRFIFLREDAVQSLVYLLDAILDHIFDSFHLVLCQVHNKDIFVYGEHQSILSDESQLGRAIKLPLSSNANVESQFTAIACPFFLLFVFEGQRLAKSVKFVLHGSN